MTTTNERYMNQQELWAHIEATDPAATMNAATSDRWKPLFQLVGQMDTLRRTVQSCLTWVQDTTEFIAAGDYTAVRNLAGNCSDLTMAIAALRALESAAEGVVPKVLDV